MRPFDPAAARALNRGDWLTFADYGGLRLVRSGAARTWVYRYRSPVDGRLRQIKIGRWPAISWERAVAAWEALRRARDEGIDPQLDRRAKRATARERYLAERRAKRADKITVARLIEEYLTGRVEKNRRPEIAAKARRLLDATIVAKYGNRPAHSIGHKDAVTFLVAEKARASAQTLILKRELGAAWRYGVAAGLLVETAPNVWAVSSAKDLGLRHSRRSRVLNDPEVKTFLAKLGDDPAEDALRFLLYVGCRSGEATGIKSGDVVDGVWHLVESKTKTARNIILPRRARELIEKYPKGFGVSSWMVGDVLRSGKHFGLATFVVHDLRRTLRTGLSRLGVPEQVAEAAIGHTKGGIVGVYDVHRFEREVGEALQRWSDHVDALQAPSVSPLAGSSAERRRGVGARL